MEKELPKGWIEKKSKRHPDKVYYFNVETCVSVWDRPTAGTSPVDNTAAKNPTLPSPCTSKAERRSSSSSPRKNIAQYRLKRLQNNLQKTQKSKPQDAMKHLKKSETVKNKVISDVKSPEIVASTIRTDKPIKTSTIVKEKSIKTSTVVSDKLTKASTVSNEKPTKIPVTAREKPTKSLTVVTEKPSKGASKKAQKTKAKKSTVSKSPLKPAYVSANDRLLNLRNDLQCCLKTKPVVSVPVQKSSSPVYRIPLKSREFQSPVPQEVPNIPFSPVPTPDNNNEVDMSNSWMSPSSENVPMDWEPINDEEILQEIKTLRETDDNGLNFSSSLSTINLPLQTKFAPQGKYYFVIDTNVFLSNLKFVENIVVNFSRKLDYSFLIVPYVVLQELDCLKARQSDRGLAQLAQHSIKYLNRQINSAETHIMVQNVFQSNDLLIQVENADDKILNCCLQIRRCENYVYLLSNDINLRNKAIVNDIEATSIEDCRQNNSQILGKFVDKMNNLI